MAIANVAFITFLALKNTPLAFLTAYSYERLNPLHQAAGYITITHAFLHATMQCVLLVDRLHLNKFLLEIEQIHGITAGSALLVMLVFAVLIKRMRYEVFYLSHIFTYIVFIINIAFHQPQVANKVVIITVVAGSMWSLDRLLRAWRLFWYSYDNRATLVPLPHGGTRIVLRRAPTRAIPGNHCFVWIPEIRAFETHPFTIVSKSLSSIELVVAAYDGFTDDLHNFAVKHPGASLRASFDGPYGTVPNFAKCADKVILIAGGSGASFTFGVALDMVRKLSHNLPKPKIDFIWAVREPGKRALGPCLYNFGCLPRH
jgi:predicted ferric reductase